MKNFRFIIFQIYCLLLFELPNGNGGFGGNLGPWLGLLLKVIEFPFWPYGIFKFPFQLELPK